MLKYKLYKNIILEMIGKIENSAKDKKEFMRDKELQDATLMRLQVIGENIKSIPFEIKKQNKNVRWKKFERLRNIISHKYESVEHELIWDFLKSNLSKLKKEIKKIK